MTAIIRTYFIDGDNIRKVPASYDAAKSIARAQDLSVATLRRSSKWEPLIEGVETELPNGWTTLGALARTKRGIATGHNEFFLLSSRRVVELGIQDQNHQPCIGRSNDVKYYRFMPFDLEQVDANGGRIRLLTFGNNLNSEELEYVKAGEEEGVSNRYLLRQRAPWYSMEKRPPAPIWALVFTRSGARFVRNNACALSLTNFHAVYPLNDDPTYHDALTCVLNSELVAKAAQAHWRRYGGGLTKFEPADLLAMPIPDISRFCSETIDEMAQLFRCLDESSRHGKTVSDIQRQVTDLLVKSNAGIQESLL